MPVPRLLARKALRDLRQGWLSFGACALITALACALFVAFSSTFVNLGRASEAAYERLRFLDFALALRPQPDSVVERIRRQPGVALATGRLALDGEILMDPPPQPPSRGRRLAARVIGLPHDRRPEVNDVFVHEGRYLGASRGEALLERRFAEVHGIGVGDGVRLARHGQEHRFTVVGLVSSPEFLWLATDRYDPRPAARRLAVVFVSTADAGHFDFPGQVNEVHVRVQDPARRDEVMAACARMLEGRLEEPPLPREEQPSNALLVRDRRAFAGVAALFPAVFLTLSALILAITMWQLVTHQRRQMGILMALGFSPRQLLAHYVGMAALVGGVGAGFGTLAGGALGVACTRLYAGFLGIPFVRAPLVAEPMIPGFGVALAASLAAGWWASRRVLTMDPARALRADFMTVARLPLGGFRFLGRTPLWLRLPLRNLLRQPGRSAVAVLGIASAVAQILMTLAFLDSQEAALRFSFDRVYAYDLRVGLQGTRSPSELPPVASFPGVLRVEGYLRANAVVRREGREERMALWGMPEAASLLRLHDRLREPLEPPRGDVLMLGPALLRRLGVEPGDPVRVELPRSGESPEQSWTVGPEIYEPIVNPGKVPLRHLQRQAAATYGSPPDGVNMLLLQVEPEAVDAVRRRLEREPLVGSVTDMRDMRRDIEDLLRMVSAWKGLMLAFASILALAILLGTTTMNVMDRSLELATMSVLGVSGSVLLRLLLLETVLLWGLGMAVGVPTGMALGNWLVNNYQSEMIQMTLDLRPGTLAGTAAASLALSLAAALQALRAVERIPLTEATQGHLS